ncbi:MAG: serine/threonine protein kinase [Kiritimatiellae bacterium]|nr:serine/threonine protein kinase [Kiritimatiellia bacterium]
MTEAKDMENAKVAAPASERRRIGPYELVRLLGRGGMSEVYEAENPRLGTRHALKLYAYEKDDPEVRERFLVEGRLLARLNHPRIVKVTDFGTDGEGGQPYFVMDLVLNGRGEMQLLSDVQPGTVDEEMVGRWYDDLREGLAYIHANGVFHRDLKLQNVLIGPDDHAVLTDFGISKIFDAKGDGVQIVDTVRTLVKMREGRSLVMGSLGYMAPELEMGVAASPQSDWYALGVIVYRMLTGTWCDARTDVVGTLETYDPVWRRIIPKLLHSNPNGRECLSYAEEKRVDREKAEFEAEERWLREKSRGHRARHIARYVAGILVVFLISGVFLWRSSSSNQRIFRAELKDVTELVDTAVEKITLARNEEEFDAFGSDIGSATQKKGSDNRKNDDIFGDFSTNSRSLEVLDPIKILLERSSVKLHNLLRQETR